MCIVAVSLAAAVPAAAPKASVAQQVNAEAEQLEGSAGVEDDLKGASSYGHGYYAGGLHGGYGGYYGGHGYYPTFSTYSYYPSYYGGHYCISPKNHIIFHKCTYFLYLFQLTIRHTTADTVAAVFTAVATTKSIIIQMLM